MDESNQVVAVEKVEETYITQLFDMLVKVIVSNYYNTLVDASNIKMDS